jgi:hypothetical protein
MSAADVEALLGPPDEVKWVQGESNWQRHRYGSLRLMLMAPPGDELDPNKLRLSSVRVWLTEPLVMPPPLRPTLTDNWVRPARDDVARRLRSVGIEFAVQVNPYSEGTMENLVISPASGGTVVLESVSGEVHSIEASKGPA